MLQSRNGRERTMFTCFVINAFTLAASPTSRRYISLNTQPNLVILGLLEILGCLVSREVVSLDLDQPFERYGPRSADCPNWTGFRQFYLGAKYDQPNGLQMKRGWCFWKADSLSLKRVKVQGKITHLFLVQKMYKTGPILVELDSRIW